MGGDKLVLTATITIHYLMPKQGISLINHLLNCIADLGVEHIIGIPGNDTSSIKEDVLHHPRISWVENCNALNAAYAADGYARIKGISVLCSGFGAHALSALSGVAVSYSEHIPVVYIIAMPPLPQERNTSNRHNTQKNLHYDLFLQISNPVVCAKAVLTKENACSEIERVLNQVIYFKKPVYLGVPEDEAHAKVVVDQYQHTRKISITNINLNAINDAVHRILEILRSARCACMIPGEFVDRCQIREVVTELVELLEIPFATTMMGKGVLNEDHPNFIGMYDAKYMNEEVRRFVEEESDVVLMIGASMTDSDSGTFISQIAPSKVINITQFEVIYRYEVFSQLHICQVVCQLVEMIKQGGFNRKTKLKVPQIKSHGYVNKNSSKLCSGINAKEFPGISTEYLFSMLERFFRPGDIIISESTMAVGLASVQLPKDVLFVNKALCGSVGYATSCAFGIRLGDSNRRTILVTTDESFQVSPQEVSQMERYNSKPIILVVKKRGNVMDRSNSPQSIPCWNYTKIPEAFGCKDWILRKVSTVKELAEYLEILKDACGRGVLVEVVCGKIGTET